jgi:hypothetical protein
LIEMVVVKPVVTVEVGADVVVADAGKGRK